MIEYDPKPNLVKVTGPLTQSEVGKLLGISRARVFELEMRAMRRLRKLLAVESACEQHMAAK
jgi:DNA-directed RNA polymerase sigma subunit (sigma70/sigma32)